MNNGNSNHPKATFKSILFGEAIILRRLNQRIKSLPQQLKPTQRKSDANLCKFVQISPWTWQMTW